MQIKNIYKSLFTLALLISFMSVQSQPALQWAKQFKGTGSDEGLCIKTDNAGNIYTAGYFWGLTDFDPGPGIDTLRASGISGFMTKFDPNGNFLWAKQIKGNHQEIVNSIAIDDSSNIYLSGMFSSVTDFDPGPGSYNLTPATINSSLFVLKLNSSGNFIWAKQFGGAWFQDLRGMTIDKNGNVYATGMFSASIDFDPGPGTYSLSVIDGPVNGYVFKLSSSGNFIWAKQFTGSSINGEAIVVDPSGNAYITGYFGGTSCDFDPGPMTYTLASQGNFEIFINKLDKNGNFIWVKQLGSGSSDYAYAIALDQYNNVYSGGYMGKSYISKIDSLGNLHWINYINNGSINGLTVDGLDNVIGVGQFGGSADFDPGPGIDSITSFGNYDAFIVKLNSKGKYICAAGIGGSDKDVATSVAVDNNQNIYTTGWFADTADFQPGPGVYNLVSMAGPTTFERGNVFVCKFGACNNLITDIEKANESDEFSVYPNPSSGKFKMIFKTAEVSEVKVSVFNIIGEKINCLFNTKSNEIDLSNERNGLYFLRVEKGEIIVTSTLIKE